MYVDAASLFLKRFELFARFNVNTQWGTRGRKNGPWTIYATEDSAAGSELFDDYGGYDNFDNVYTYGMYLDDNPNKLQAKTIKEARFRCLLMVAFHVILDRSLNTIDVA